eukprot:1157395-Pelagomonas_calceolata.AAC.3
MGSVRLQETTKASLQQSKTDGAVHGGLRHGTNKQGEGPIDSQPTVCRQSRPVCMQSKGGEHASGTSRQHKPAGR